MFGNYILKKYIILTIHILKRIITKYTKYVSFCDCSVVKVICAVILQCALSLRKLCGLT